MPGSLTYPAVGATMRPGTPMPPAYRHFERRVCVGNGSLAFRRVANGVLTWQVLLGAGLAVRSDAVRAAEGVEVTSTLILGPLRIDAPCRVIGVFDEADRAGFAYGTLRGHPESGEEAFLVERDSEGFVWFTIRVFSRPDAWWSILGGPVTHAIQRRVTSRYVFAAFRLAEGFVVDRSSEPFER